jgi:hypothetical protein
MSRLARWIAPAALAGGLVAGLFAIPAAQASSAASITINATSPHFPGLKAKDHGKVDGFALVIYKIATVNTATVNGNVTVSSSTATDTATLMAEPFGKTKYTAVGTPVSLTPGTNGVAPYSFFVTPSLRTHYEVQVSGTDSVTSTAVTVYVTVGSTVGKPKISCTSARCVETVKVSTTVPTSAYKTESRKHVYLYLAIGHFRGTKAILPKDYTLSTASSASKARRNNSGKFTETLRFVIPHPKSNTVWLPNACSKDAVTKDGIGLPGNHGCGNKHIPRNTIYIG